MYFSQTICRRQPKPTPSANLLYFCTSCKTSAEGRSIQHLPKAAQTNTFCQPSLLLYFLQTTCRRQPKPTPSANLLFFCTSCKTPAEGSPNQLLLQTSFTSVLLAKHLPKADQSNTCRRQPKPIPSANLLFFCTSCKTPAEGSPNQLLLQTSFTSVLLAKHLPKAAQTNSFCNPSLLLYFLQNICRRQPKPTPSANLLYFCTSCKTSAEGSPNQLLLQTTCRRQITFYHLDQQPPFPYTTLANSPSAPNQATVSLYSHHQSTNQPQLAGNSTDQ
jgi:ribosomal protein L44E